MLERGYARLCACPVIASKASKREAEARARGKEATQLWAGRGRWSELIDAAISLARRGK